MDESESTEEKKEKLKSIVLEVQSLRHVLTSTIKPQPAEKKENEKNG